MMNLEPVALSDSWEECPGFFIFGGRKRVTQTLELSPQYLEAVCRKVDLKEEQKLMLAVLNDAVTCFQKHFVARDKIGMSLFREAEDWILLQGKDDWLFSFDNICETLDLDPAYIRGGLQRWRTIGLENGTGFDLKSIRDGTLPKEG